MTDWIFLSLLLWCFTAQAQPHTDDYWTDYESGALGKYPQVTYKSSRISTPLVRVRKWNESCDPHGYVLMSPHGERIADNKLILLDSKGNLVWWQQEQGAVHNIQVQQYRGNDYITYWVGDDEFWGHGAGYYKMVCICSRLSCFQLTWSKLDQTYTHAYTLTAVGDMDGDYHEFSITRDNTALITAYVKTPWDLSAYGREDGFIWDCVFQEVDVETNDLLFEWRASEHFRFKDMAVNSWAAWTGHAGDPWDWFHLNAVEKDSNGNYLVAARYTNAITYINGTNGGKRIWQLGGTKSSFNDISAGGASRFVDPHAVHWDDDEHTSLTVFDNIDFRSWDKPKKHSRAAKIELDMLRRTANLTVDFQHPYNVYGRAEGSVQKLENNNYLINYGSAPVYSEFSATGDHLCETHWAPMRENEGILESLDAVDTYRIYKSRWTGYPVEPPIVLSKPEALFLHWNGATEVRSWQVEGRGAFGKSASRYITLGQYKHDSFELVVPLSPAVAYASFRLMALDGTGKTLGMWRVDHRGRVYESQYDDAARAALLPYLMPVIAASLFVAYLKWRNYRASKGTVWIQEKQAKC